MVNIVTFINGSFHGFKMVTYISEFSFKQRMANNGNEYAAVLEKLKTGESLVDAYAHQIGAEMRSIDRLIPKIGALNPMYARVDEFLRAHTGMGYEDFIRSARPEELITEDYGKLPPKMRRRLFDYRARLHVAALEHCESIGLDISEILTKASSIKIPFVKKESAEPAFDKLAELLIRP